MLYPEASQPVHKDHGQPIGSDVEGGGHDDTQGVGSGEQLALPFDPTIKEIIRRTRNSLPDTPRRLRLNGQAVLSAAMARSEQNGTSGVKTSGRSNYRKNT